MCRLRTLALVVIAPTFIAATMVADGADRLAPRVRITRPADGAVVSDHIYVDVSYKSLSGQPIVRVDLFIDGIRRSNVSLVSPRLVGVQSFRWDTRKVSSAMHTVQAQVYDAAGHNGAAKIRVYVKNTHVPAPAAPPTRRDLIPPTVRVAYPTNGAVVSGRIEIGVEATDDNGVDSVVFYLDDKFLALTNQAPYKFALDTARLTDGLHTTHGVAYDTSDNRGESAKAYFTVDNFSATGGAPPPPVSPKPVVVGGGRTEPSVPIVAPPPPERKTEVAAAPAVRHPSSPSPATDRA
ncbi:MAG: Ig-like domain-containing protein, partial [Armatimonadota bacterium]